MIQGDDPSTEQVEPEDELYAIERFFFLIPANESWTEVPVPKIARMEGMSLNNVVYSSSSGYIPGDFSVYWNQANPPFKQFKDMTDMECCVADFYAWGFPLNPDRNQSVYTQVDTDAEFIQYFDDVKSQDAWNFSTSGLSLKPGYEYGNYISTPTEMGLNITQVEMSWDVLGDEENISFFVSVNNGTDWLNVTEDEGKDFNFTNEGNELIWKVNMSQDVEYNNTPILNNLWINASYMPQYTDIAFQLDYVIERNSGKFEYVWDLYKDYENGILPHILIYTDKDHELKTDDIDIELYGAQEEFPDKDVYIFMQGAYSPEATVTITQMTDPESEFPWILLLILIIIVIIVLVLLLSRSKKPQEEVITEPKETEISENQQAEHANLTQKKEGLLKALKKLDSDYKEGLLDEDVYSDLKGNYKKKTIDVMKQIDVLAAAPVAPSAPPPSPEKEALKEKKEKILMGIKKLDSDYEEGLLDEETYKELREDYKKKAVEIAKEIESFKEK
jgi:hypothetical protein